MSWTHAEAFEAERPPLRGSAVASAVTAFPARSRAHLARGGDAEPANEPGASWSAARLSAFVRETFKGERLIVVSNREPIIHDRAPDGTIREREPASGVVTALEPLSLACQGTWIAHGSGSADRAVVDGRDGLMLERQAGRYRLRRLWISSEHEAGYYYGFANSGLWPLCHLAHVKPVFRADDLQCYWHVNNQFAQAVADEAESDSPVVLLQDYHFALAPRMIRERLPHATTVTFWHIPWPNRHRFAICPWRRELLEGLLGSSVLGFQTATDCHNFLDAVQLCLEANVDRESSVVTYEGRRVLVRPYPISIEWPVTVLEGVPGPDEARAVICCRLGLPPDTRLLAGVDRLDYTKGLEEKLAGVETLLETHRALRGRVVLVQVAAPSRDYIDSYRTEAMRVREAAARLNARFGEGRYRPVVLLEESWAPHDVFTLFRAADACVVTSLHDGMNLVAKEFVAARTDRDGVLVLSPFAGAARELTDALIANPYDAADVASALQRALCMPAGERRERMAAMRSVVARDNAYRWAARMLRDAAAARRDETRTGSNTSREAARVVDWYC
jgi:trehalose 6-phosphate synthase